ncbi:MAG: LTA synthase family protein [Rikenellaceae bacterium]
MRKRGLEISNSFILMIVRIALLYLLMGLCRVLFYCYNADLMAPVSWNALLPILKGSFVFDSASIFYVNILFVFLSLIPFYFRETNVWQHFLGFIFAVSNGIAILINLCDVFYYPYKLARIAGDDLRYLQEGIFAKLLAEYWWAVVLVVLFMVLLYYVGFVMLRPYRRRRFISNTPFFYLSQSVVAIACTVMAVIAIRGFNISKASFPITVSDATNYVEPQYADLILSNPFSLIRTAGHKLREPKFTSTETYSPVKQVDTCAYDMRGMNVMIFVLESFGSAHFKSISDSFAPEDPSFTSFLDSLFQHGTLFVNAYQSGGRSIDAMPSIWASIPSFKQNFLSLPQSQSKFHALPAILCEMGYTTSFMHGSVSTSMSFKAFGQMAGVKNFTFREDYGDGDFDGKWGIWDHKFLPFALSKMNELKEPFFNTLFTLSSHHPFLIPPGFENKYPKGKEPIDETIAYSDDALRAFFAQAKKEKWYNNTLFIFTADHGSGADNEKWKTAPYSHRVPLFLYTPNGLIPSAKIEKVVGQVDIMPTLLSMMHYEKSFFSYGENMFSDKPGFAANYSQGLYNIITDSAFYQLDDNGYTTPVKDEKSKAYLLNYYQHIKERRFTTE